MRIPIDDIIVGMQPDTLTWEQPRMLGADGRGAPVRAPYWACRLGFSRLTCVQYEAWEEAWRDGDLHDIELPHPKNGDPMSYSVYVSEFSPRMDVQDVCVAAMAGADITLTRVYVV